MNSIEYIRIEVLGMSQSDLAALTGVSQATVSRWEKGLLSPDLSALDAIRTEVRRRKKPFNDAWFFSAPTEAKAKRAGAAA